MPSKTPSISQFFLFIAGMFSIHSANAAAPRNLEECKQAYFTAVMVPVAQRETPTVQSQLKAWCTTQCVDEKINIYASQQSKTITEALKAELSPTYQPACVAQYAAASSSTVATTPATTGTGTGTASATPTQCVVPAGQTQLTPTQNSACQQALEQQRQAQLALQQQQQQQPTTGAQQPSAGQQQRAAIVAPLLNAAMSGLQSASTGSSAGTGGSTGGSSGSPGSYALPQLDLSATPSPGSAPPAPIPAPQNAGAAADTAAGSMNDNISNLEQPIRGPASEASEKVETDRSGKTVVPRSAISQSAQQNAQTLANDANDLLRQLRERFCKPIANAKPIDDNPEGVYKETLAKIEKAIGNSAATAASVCTSISNYTNPSNFNLGSSVPADNVPVTANAEGAGAATPADSGSGTSESGQQKDNPLTAYNRGRAVSCAGDAERAEKLCVESDSMKALKNVMDIAGPVLMGLNAAARTCGGMNNVSKFVGAGLTAANAICIAKKMKCEKTCSQLAGEFNKSMAELISDVQASATKDNERIETDICNPHKNAANIHNQNANSAVDPQKTELINLAKEELAKHEACQAANKALLGIASQAKGRITAFKQRESSPSTPGTAIAMDAKCKAKTRNIIGLATNIGAIALAAANARKCEKELAAPGAADNGGIANVSNADYCSNEATSGSQFCKCQSSPSTEGCGQVLAAGPPSENTAQDQRGVNLQNGRGPSGFAGAGGGSGSGSSSGYRGYDSGADGYGTGQANLGSISSTMGGGAGNPAMGLAGGASGGSGTASANSSDAKAAAKKEDDKAKWSFGSIASSIGGSLGFGGGSRGGDNGSNLKDDQRERIERKLASDRLAAEISPSTGADNFSKIKRSYVQKADTFMAP